MKCLNRKHPFFLHNSSFKIYNTTLLDLRLIDNACAMIFILVLLRSGRGKVQVADGKY